jgi:hypothetical protein
LVCHHTGKAQINDVSKHNAAKNIWMQDGGGNRRVEKITLWSASYLIYPEGR